MKLLVIDDDADFRSLIERTAPSWLEVTAGSSSRDAIRLLAAPTALDPDLAVVDLHLPPCLAVLPDFEGLALARWLQAQESCFPVILISSRRMTESISDGLAVIGVLAKPLDLSRLYRFLAAHDALFGRGAHGSRAGRVIH